MHELYGLVFYEFRIGIRNLLYDRTIMYFSFAFSLLCIIVSSSSSLVLSFTSLLLSFLLVVSFVPLCLQFPKCCLRRNSNVGHLGFKFYSVVFMNY